MSVCNGGPARYAAFHGTGQEGRAAPGRFQCTTDRQHGMSICKIEPVRCRAIHGTLGCKKQVFWGTLYSPTIPVDSYIGVFFVGFADENGYSPPISECILEFWGVLCPPIMTSDSSKIGGE